MKLTMPELIGSRESAEKFTEDLPMSLEQEIVVVDASFMKASSQSFADELVHQVLYIRNAKKLIVEAPTTLFADRLRKSSVVHKLAEKLEVTRER